jgi:hypothetical protein
VPSRLLHANERAMFQRILSGTSIHRSPRNGRRIAIAYATQGGRAVKSLSRAPFRDTIRRSNAIASDAVIRRAATQHEQMRGRRSRPPSADGTIEHIAQSAHRTPPDERGPASEPRARQHSASAVA